MVRDAILVGSSAAAIYGWLCAVVPPLVRAIRTATSRHTAAAWGALALAAGGALLWTIVPAAIGFVFLMLEPQTGLALVGSAAWVPGVVAGAACWVSHAATARRVPRIGPDFEVATALAIVALVRDDSATLARIEQLYRAHAAPSEASPSGYWALAAGN